MKVLIFITCLFMFWLGLLSFFLSQKHVLVMLMLLEFCSLSVLFMLVNYFCDFYLDVVIIIYFIIIMVCEAVMGLVLLTLMVRTHGSDYFKTSCIFVC